MQDILDDVETLASPLQYLTHWRIHLAGTWLHEEDITLAQCAIRLGYESEAAFSRAFKRVVGVAPGTWKKRQHEPVTH